MKHSLLAILSGILMVLSFPRYDLSWVIAIALTPLLIVAARVPSPARRFLFGWTTGIVCLAGVTDWIRFVLEVHGGLGALGGWVVFLLYCMAKGLYFGVFALLAGPVLQLGWAVPAVAALWVAVDITFGSLGFVWVTLGNAGADMSLPMRLAPYTGVHGLSFVFMMMSASLAVVFLRLPRRQLLWLVTAPLLILLPPLPDPQAGDRQAVIVQPNVEEASFTTESVDELERRLVLLSMQAFLRAGDRKPELLVWPEVPAPFYYEEDINFRNHANSLTRVTRAYFLLGTVARTKDGAPLNSALLLSPRGEPVSRYDKIELVPFGEYVPWPFGFAGKITSEVGDFKRGSRIVVSPVGDHKLAGFICYESAFPGLVRQFVRGGAEVLFNLSNDGYFGRSASARGQHLLVVRMRAAENSRWILRATNDGISAAVDPAGRVVQRLPQFQQLAARVAFSYRADQTIYTRHGDWFAWSCAAASALALAGPAAIARASRSGPPARDQRSS